MRVFRQLSIPEKAHPLVRLLFQEMNRQHIGVLDMSDRSGINKNTLQDWRTRTVPTVDNLEACFTVLGCKLTIRQSRED